MRRSPADNFVEINSLSAIAHLIAHRPQRIRRLIFLTAPEQLKRRVSDLQHQAKAAGIAMTSAPQKGRGLDPVVAHLEPFAYNDFKEFLQTTATAPRSLVLALDHLQDPQNFGALCRTAEAFGIAGILLPKDRGVQVTPGVYHASVGAVETVPIVMVANLGEGLRRLKEAGYWVIGSAIGGDAKPPWETPDFEKAVLVMGAELEGISPVIEKNCDWKIEIPMAGQIQSLNVGAAGAVLMYELTRPNRGKK
jgi:23S rRNA (guanosine2251-2'-O)-methyltransferase